MLGQPEILVFLCDYQYFSYYEKNGLVLTSSVPAPLIFTPQGWEEYSIEVVRNERLFALDRSFSIPFKFVEDGARIVKERCYKYGTEDTVYLVILRRTIEFDATHYGIVYKHLYKGELDLSEMKHQGPAVTINIMEGGIPKFYKANENVKYEFPMSDADLLVKHTGVDFKTSITFTNFAESFLTAANSVTPNKTNEFFITFFKLTEEGKLIGVLPSDVYGQKVTNVDYENDENYFLRALSAITLNNNNFKFEFDLSANLTGAGSFKLELVKGPPSAGTVVHTFYNNNSIAAGTTTVNIDQTISLSLAENERLFIRGTCSVLYSGIGPSATVSFVTREQNSTINYTYKHPDSYVRYYDPYTLFKLLVERITEGRYEGESDLLKNLPNVPKVAITCGDALRGFDSAILKTTMSDFFISINAIHCIGLGVVNGKLRLEKKEYWVDYTNPLVVGGAAPTPTYSPAKNYLFNTFKFGYPHKDIEGVNGRYTFNNTQLYTGPNSRQAKEYDAVSKYYADPYVIEDIRINFEGKTTTDDRGDNEIYFTALMKIPALETIDGEDVLVYELDRSLNNYASDHPETATIFNLAITPKQNLFRHGRFIRSCHYKLDHKFLKFQTTEKWKELIVSKPGSRVVDEDADVEIGTLGDQLFIPWTINIEVESPADLIDALELTPVKAVQYNDGSLTLAGLITKASIEPSTNDAQEYTLLSSPNNNLIPLIEIFD
jgi:hypothetical protein